MPLRIGFDLDGVLADFAASFRDYSLKLFGPIVPVNTYIGVRRLPGDQPETEEARQAQAERDAIEHVRELRRREDAIWKAIEGTPDFWTTVRPTEEGAVRRLYELTLKHKWEVVFITQRPYTEGETVQRQTQRWLIAQGFDMPSVLVISGSRGAAAKAVRLDYHVDDTPQNCFDVIGDSSARPILIVPRSQEQTVAGARKLGIGIAHGIGEALDILDQASLARSNPNLLKRLATMVGWK
jgi:hypothetical protein